MKAPPPPTKKTYWSIILGVLGGAVIAVMLLLAYLLLTLPAPEGGVTPTPQVPVLSLPTAPAPTATPGPPPSPPEAIFVAEEPVQGFSDCNRYGFLGVVAGIDGQQLADVQVVVWEDRAGLLALATTDAAGKYAIELKAKPAPRKLWLQLYQNDEPVSEPVLLQTQVNCQTGFQVYQVNWRKIKP